MDAIAKNEASRNTEPLIRNFISLLPPKSKSTPISPRLKTHSLDQRHQLFVFPLSAPQRDRRILAPVESYPTICITSLLERCAKLLFREWMLLEEKSFGDNSRAGR